MAHKKSGGSSKNGRTAIGKRRKLAFMAQALVECAIPPRPAGRNGLWSRPR